MIGRRADAIQVVVGVNVLPGLAWAPSDQFVQTGQELGVAFVRYASSPWKKWVPSG